MVDVLLYNRIDSVQIEEQEKPRTREVFVLLYHLRVQWNLSDNGAEVLPDIYKVNDVEPSTTTLSLPLYMRTEVVRHGQHDQLSMTLAVIHS